MNLITNCCIGGDYYNAMKIEYNNPFTWVIIKPVDMILLIKHFDTVDFWNIKLLPSEFSNDNRKCFKLKIDNLFEIHYPHYLKNENYKTIHHGSTETSVDILYANIEDYIIETYQRRLFRMIKSKEEPKFLILGDRKGYEWSLSDIEYLDNLPKKYKICLITDRKISVPIKNIYLINFNSDNHYLARIKNDKLIRRYLEF